jgi:UDP-N-acetyl-2-amino-2-deoxyglucuronate dehydrogenase
VRTHLYRIELGPVQLFGASYLRRLVAGKEDLMDVYNFAVIGVGGYIAPRHLKAIKATGNRVIAAIDKGDSVGILDSWFPEAAFFTEFERFDRHVEKLRRLGYSERVHFVSICSPNYLHDAHMRFALRVNADAICEKPMVLNPWNIDALRELEQESGRRLFCILQLRVHPAIVALKEKMAKTAHLTRPLIDLTYVTSRGRWYSVSWKGSVEKSGGIATNIGIHFFDMLMWIFGPVQLCEVHHAEPARMAGFLHLENADVRWFLSVDRRDLPQDAKASGKSTYRYISIDQTEIEFSDGFTDLHTMVYEDILAGRGFGLDDARPSIELVSQLRKAEVQKPEPQRRHPLLNSNSTGLSSAEGSVHLAVSD